MDSCGIASKTCRIYWPWIYNIKYRDILAINGLFRERTPMKGMDAPHRKSLQVAFLQFIGSGYARQFPQQLQICKDLDHKCYMLQENSYTASCLSVSLSLNFPKLP